MNTQFQYDLSSLRYQGTTCWRMAIRYKNEGATKAWLVPFPTLASV